MSSLWVTAALSVTAAITTAMYNTGGRGALERRMMRQELEVAALLPPGQERDLMEQTARDRAAAYVSRRLGEEPFRPRQHGVLLGFTALGLGIGYCGAMLSRTVSPHTPVQAILDSLASLMMVSGFIFAAAGFTAWLSRVIIAHRTQSRRQSVAVHRDKLTAHIARKPRRA